MRNLDLVIKAINNDTKGLNKHLDILKGLVFASSSDTKEVESIIKAYEEAYDTYNISSHNIYKGYYKRVLNIPFLWLHKFIELNGIIKSEVTRDTLLKNVLFTNKQFNVKRISYYRSTLKDLIKDKEDKKAFLSDLLVSGYNVLLVDKGDEDVLKDVISSMVEKIEEDEKAKKERIKAYEEEHGMSDVVAPIAEEESVTAEDEEESVTAEKSMTDYIIEKLALLDDNQLGRVVDFIDHL